MNSIFDEGTTIPANESPADAGHEEEAAGTPGAEEQEVEEQDTEQETEANLDEEETEQEDENTSPDDSGHGDDQLLAGKYKSVEELTDAYLNLQREFTRSRQQPAQQPAAQPGQQQPAATPDVKDTFWKLMDEDPLGTIQYLIQNAVTQQTAPILEKDRNNALAKNIEIVAKDYQQVRTPEGMQQLFGRVNEIAQEFGNPALAQNPTPRVLQLAASEVFGDTKADVYRKAKAAGREEAAAARQAKQGLASIQTRKAPNNNNEQPLSEEDQIRQGIVAAGRSRGLLG